MLIKSELHWDCKVGATYGKAFCGLVGSKSRHEYAILGPSVNLAARLMAHELNTGIILVDEAVKNQAGDREFKSLDPIEAKGLGLVEIYQPLQSKTKVWTENPHTFVERDREVKKLQSMAEDVVSQSLRSSRDNVHTLASSKLVFLSGPYGIGKSYLLRHTANCVEQSCKQNHVSHLVTRHIFNDVDSIKPFR